jgi:hypothetical protein
MIRYSESKVDYLSVHVVGNSLNGEALTLSSEPLDIYSDALQKLLLTYFLSNFTSPEYYNLKLENGVASDHRIFQFCSSVFADPTSLHKGSLDVAQHLYEVTRRPNIKSGDLYVAYLSSIQIDGMVVDAIGIFKSETKDSYLKLSNHAKAFTLESDSGLNIHKVDKGCLILNVESENGFKILAIDNTNKADAQFWKNEFLHVIPCSDSFHHTQNFMNLTRQFVDDQLDEEFGVTKADKIEMLNRSKAFFKNHDQFNHEQFDEEVFTHPSVAESFRNYERTLTANNEADIIDNFEISAQAVKKQLRVFKSVLKLDKNFHIYIHGNKHLIEKGFDEVANKHFYKLYFDNES